MSAAEFMISCLKKNNCICTERRQKYKASRSIYCIPHLQKQWSGHAEAIELLDNQTAAWLVAQTPHQLQGGGWRREAEGDVLLHKEKQTQGLIQAREPYVSMRIFPRSPFNESLKNELCKWIIGTHCVGSTLEHITWKRGSWLASYQLRQTSEASFLSEAWRKLRM